MLEGYFIHIKYGDGTGKGYIIEFGCSGDEQSLIHCSNTNTQVIGWMQCDALSMRCKQGTESFGFHIDVCSEFEGFGLQTCQTKRIHY